MSEPAETSQSAQQPPEAPSPVTIAPAPATSLRRRPKSRLRKRLEALQPGEVLRINYRGRKTPFAVLMAIKRQQLKKHFVFAEEQAGRFRIWIGQPQERSHSRRKAKPAVASASSSSAPPVVVTPTQPEPGPQPPAP